MDIRCANGEDAAEISKLIKGVAHSFMLKPDGKGAEEFLDSIEPPAIRGYIGSEEFQYFVGLICGQIVGVIALRAGRHLFHLFVAEAYQGKGLAKILWQHMRKSVVTPPGVHHITVNSTVSALPVYVRFGFTKAGEKEEIKGIAFVPMILELQLRHAG